MFRPVIIKSFFVWLLRPAPTSILAITFIFYKKFELYQNFKIFCLFSRKKSFWKFKQQWDGRLKSFSYKKKVRSSWNRKCKRKIYLSSKAPILLSLLLLLVIVLKSYKASQLIRRSIRVRCIFEKILNLIVPKSSIGQFVYMKNWL